jgi:hypothetical protein
MSNSKFVKADAVKILTNFLCQNGIRHGALVHYDIFAISKVLPTVPKIRLSCIFCTWFPLRRSEDTPVEHPGREPGSTGQGGALYSMGCFPSCF